MTLIDEPDINILKTYLRNFYRFSKVDLEPNDKQANRPTKRITTPHLWVVKYGLFVQVNEALR